MHFHGRGQVVPAVEEVSPRDLAEAGLECAKRKRVFERVELETKVEKDLLQLIVEFPDSRLREGLFLPKGHGVKTGLLETFPELLEPGTDFGRLAKDRSEVPFFFQQGYMVFYGSVLAWCHDNAFQ